MNRMKNEEELRKEKTQTSCWPLEHDCETCVFSFSINSMLLKRIIYLFTWTRVFSWCAFSISISILFVRAVPCVYCCCSITFMLYSRCWDETNGKPVFELIVLRTRVKTFRSSHSVVCKPGKHNVCMWNGVCSVLFVLTVPSAVKRRAYGVYAVAVLRWWHIHHCIRFILVQAQALSEMFKSFYLWSFSPQR